MQAPDPSNISRWIRHSDAALSGTRADQAQSPSTKRRHTVGPARRVTFAQQFKPNRKRSNSKQILILKGKQEINCETFTKKGCFFDHCTLYEEHRDLGSFFANMDKHCTLIPTDPANSSNTSQAASVALSNNDNDLQNTKDIERFEELLKGFDTRVNEDEKENMKEKCVEAVTEVEKSLVCNFADMEALRAKYKLANSEYKSAVHHENILKNLKTVLDGKNYQIGYDNKSVLFDAIGKAQAIFTNISHLEEIDLPAEIREKSRKELELFKNAIDENGRREAICAKASRMFSEWRVIDASLPASVTIASDRFLVVIRLEFLPEDVSADGGIAVSSVEFGMEYLDQIGQCIFRTLISRAQISKMLDGPAKEIAHIQNVIVLIDEAIRTMDTFLAKLYCESQDSDTHLQLRTDNEIVIRFTIDEKSDLLIGISVCESPFNLTCLKIIDLSLRYDRVKNLRNALEPLILDEIKLLNQSLDIGTFIEQTKLVIRSKCSI